MDQDNIPEQYKGSKTDTISEKEFQSEGEARQHFEIVKERFLDINNWQQVAGQATASFSLTDGKGSEVNRRPQVGDYFKINIPGPNNDAGDGYDWVKIKDINESRTEHEESISILVQPASNPLNDEKEKAHFFDKGASSTFMISRSANVVSAQVHGRNETPNNDDVGLIDKVRNTVVAVGAMLGFSKIQWKSLTNGLVDIE